VKRQFRAGAVGQAGGVEYRIVQGKKHPDDLRLDLRARDWVPVGMALGFLLSDFFNENENVLYPPEQGFKGGKMWLDYLIGAAEAGWEAAADLLRDQRERRAA
jgi:hypothetical protein